MRWIVALLATITAAKAVSREEFYGDNSCSCTYIDDPDINRCCDDSDYHCICHSDDDSSLSIALTSPLPFYGQNYTYACVSYILSLYNIWRQHSHNSVQINTNGGLVLLNESLNDTGILYFFQNDLFPIESHVFIAPFYGDIDTRSKGIVWYSMTVINDTDLLKKAADHVQLTKHNDFSPKYLLVATWDDVGYYRERSDKVGVILPGIEI